MSNLDIALDIAVEAHKGQKDKAGHPYINHPFRISTKMDTEEEKIVALLHDVVEDSNLTISELSSYGFSQEILNAICCITKTKGEDYDLYIEKVKTNELATKVKIADLIDNISLSRLKVVTVKDINRTRKYLDALEYLIS